MCGGELLCPTMTGRPSSLKSYYSVDLEEMMQHNLKKREGASAVIVVANGSYF
jgi:hypothetical protein